MIYIFLFCSTSEFFVSGLTHMKNTDTAYENDLLSKSTAKSYCFSHFVSYCDDVLTLFNALL